MNLLIGMTRDAHKAVGAMLAQVLLPDVHLVLFLMDDVDELEEYLDRRELDAILYFQEGGTIYHLTEELWLFYRTPGKSESIRLYPRSVEALTTDAWARIFNCMMKGLPI